MYIHINGAVKDSIPIQFTAAPTETENTWIWKTEYVSEKYPVVKDYKLVLHDSTKNIYHMDEGDGLILLNYVIGNKMYCLFEIEDQYITASYELSGENLIFEVTVGLLAGETAADVTNYSIQNVQRVVLSRVK